MRKIWIPIIFLLLVGPLTLAEPQVSVPDICSVVPSAITVDVMNDGAADTFRITALGPQLSWVSFNNSAVKINSGKEGSFSVRVTPPKFADPGTYNIPIRIYTDSRNFIHNDNICVFVRDVREVSFNNFTYNQNSFSPDQRLEANYEIENSGTEGFVDVDLLYEMEGPSKVTIESRSFDLDRGDVISFSEKIDISPEMMPGSYTLKITAVKEGRELGSYLFPFEVEVTENLIVDRKNIWTPIASFNKIIFDNRGNVHSSGSFSYEIRRPFNAFVSTSGNPEIIENDRTVEYVWGSTLSPGGSEKASYRINYWPILLIILGILYAGYRSFFSLRRPIMRKVLLNSRRLNEHMQEFTVALEIKNKTPHNIKTVEIRDFVPSMAKVVNDFGALKPKTKVTDGTELIWTIKDFKRDDSRMIRYRIVTVVGAVEKFKLTKAVMTGKIMKRLFRVHSNELIVGSDRDE